MTTNWTHFLDFAVALLNQPVPAIAAEIQYRVIVGRAYYAAFHTARLHLEDYYGQRWNVERGTHAQVIEQFERPAHEGYMQVAQDLLRLKRLRVRADYRAHPAVSVDDAQAAIEMADDIIRAIARLP